MNLASLTQIRRASLFPPLVFGESLVLLLAAVLVSASAFGQSLLLNGYMHYGSIPTNGATDTWIFAATAGERVLIRVGDVTNSPTLEPGIWLYQPGGQLLASHAGGGDYHEVEVTLTNSGVFTVVVADGVSSDGGKGDYRLTLLRLPGDFILLPGDEGGPMTNGVMHLGTIPEGDLDVWTFTASVGDRIALRVGDSTNAAGFQPGFRLYGPDRASLERVATPDLEIVATNSGIFTVVVGDRIGSDGGAGAYRLTLGKSSGAVGVSSGDEGGPMTNGVSHLGVISSGDLDVWTFYACHGDSIEMEIRKLSGNVFSPKMRLFFPNGSAVPGNGSGKISVLAPLSGTYSVIVGDADTAEGTYQLSGTGISNGSVRWQPIAAGTNLIFRSVDGPACGSVVVLASPEVDLPLDTWTPIWTNQIGPLGEFTLTNAIEKSIPKQFFYLRMQ